MNQTIEAEAPPKAAVTVANLKHALKIVGAGLENKTTIPVLSCIRMEQLDEGFAFEATNLDIALRALIPESNGPEKPVVMPGEKLIAWAKLLAGEEVAISLTKSRATLQCAGARAVMPILSASPWPQVAFAAAGDGATLSQGPLARALSFGLIAVSEDPGRYTLNGIHAESDGTVLRLVSTNGHCMAVYTLPCVEKFAALLLPSSFAKAVLPLLAEEDGAFDLTADETSIRASIPGTIPSFVHSKKMQGTFPEWRRIFPKDDRTEVTVKVAEMLPALERATLLSDERSGALVLNFQDDREQIVIEGASPDHGEAQESVACHGTAKEPLRICVYGKYLITLVKKLSGEIRFALPKDPQSSLLIKAQPHEGETLEYIIMPMRV